MILAAYLMGLVELTTVLLKTSVVCWTTNTTATISSAKLYPAELFGGAEPNKIQQPRRGRLDPDSLL